MHDRRGKGACVYYLKFRPGRHVDSEVAPPNPKVRMKLKTRPTSAVEDQLKLRYSLELSSQV